MKLHPEELALAQAYTREHSFEELSVEQMNAIMDRGRALYHWYKAHPHVHNAISLAVFGFLFGADFLTIFKLPYWLLPSGPAHSTPRLLLAAAAVGALHSWLMYSLGIYSLHEGAAHNNIFVFRGRLGLWARAAAANVCRLAASEPIDYSANHMSHHAKFGTPH